MKTQKLLVIVALICLMVFINVLSFARTAQAQPNPERMMVRLMAQVLRAEGYKVVRSGNSLKIATNHGELNLDLTATGEELEDSGIGARLVPPAVMSAEDPPENTEDFQQLQLCLNAADLNFRVSSALCELYIEDADDFLCKTEATFDRILSSLKCVALYVPPPPPTGDVVSVFVTRGKFDGNLGGLAGADDICQAAADAAELGGTDWTAWLSDSTGNAIDRIPDGQYRLIDGTTQVADDKVDLTDGRLKAGINLNEDGQPWAGVVWTGTEEDGTGTGSNCNNWTDAPSNFGGSFGASGADNSQWTKLPYDPAQCSEKYHLYCFGGVE
jgi:hypothetical protein